MDRMPVDSQRPPGIDRAPYLWRSSQLVDGHREGLHRPGRQRDPRALQRDARPDPPRRGRPPLAAQQAAQVAAGRGRRPAASGRVPGLSGGPRSPGQFRHVTGPRQTHAAAPRPACSWLGGPVADHQLLARRTLLGIDIDDDHQGRHDLAGLVAHGDALARRHRPAPLSLRSRKSRLRASSPRSARLAGYGRPGARA